MTYSSNTASRLMLLSHSSFTAVKIKMDWHQSDQQSLANNVSE